MEDEKRENEEMADIKNEEKDNEGRTSEPPRGEEPKRGGPDAQAKAVCAVAYIFGILFFLPLILCPNDEFAKFHANQSLVVLLVSAAGGVLFGLLTMLPAVGVVFAVLSSLFALAMFVLCILGIVGAAQGKTDKLPVLGGISILK